ncbi:MAG: hypothetical protein IPM54_08830 [Polyangiaceae bacterium]|nr:hypothetical protein [Polyangiaceae bacterium]
MKIWQLMNPHDYAYADAIRVGGTWQPGEYQERRRPIVIEWQPDSDVVGDFTWPGFAADLVITDQVARALTDRGIQGFELRAVEMFESAKVAKMSRRRSKRPRVRLPYTGPKLWDLWVTAWRHADMERSTITIHQRADGSTDYDLSGVQHEETICWDPEKGVIREMRPRIEGQGLFVPLIDGFFRVFEFDACIFCTDNVKCLIEEHRFTNVSFLEMGDVLNTG